MASLEELKKRLYRQEDGFLERAHPPDISRDKENETIFPSQEDSYKIPPKENFFMKTSKSKKIRIIFVIAVFLFAVAIFYGSGIFDFKNIEVKIEGQKEIKSGENIEWLVAVSNRNAGDIDDASLVFNIPDVIRERVLLGKMKSGEERILKFESIVFGGRNKEFTAKATLEYKPKGASAFFAEDSSFVFTIAQSPVTVSLDLPSEARAGQEIKILLKYFSQSEALVSDLYAKINYPSGFEFKSANPLPSESNNLWAVGDIESGKDGTIEIIGVLKETGAVSESFTASIGVKKEKDILNYDEVTAAVILRSPFLGVDILPQGQMDLYKASLGEEINVVVRWKNNLPEKLENALLEVKIENDNVDLASVRVRNGSFSSFLKTITWNSSTYNDFSNIVPGATGVVSFSFKIKNNLVLSESSPRPKIILKAVFKPGKIVQGFQDTEISGEDEVEIPISSKIQFSARGLYFGSTIPNSGPLPPKSGEKTTYTINWSLANPLNDIKNTIVKTSLPPYINFEEVFIPQDANLVFDKSNGSLEWRVGTLSAGTGFLRPALSVSFQVGLVPSDSQIGSLPIIINTTDVSGVDSFTEENLSARDREITTDLRGDSTIDFNQKKVVK